MNRSSAGKRPEGGRVLELGKGIFGMGRGLLSKEMGMEVKTAEEEFDIMSCPKFIKVTKVINEGRTMDVADMDFSKAFNKVPQGRLIQKIKVNEIHGDCVEFAHSPLVCVGFLRVLRFPPTDVQ
eukprot:g33629.t1